MNLSILHIESDESDECNKSNECKETIESDLSNYAMPTPRTRKGRPSGFLDTIVKTKKKNKKK